MEGTQPRLLPLAISPDADSVDCPPSNRRAEHLSFCVPRSPWVSLLFCAAAIGVVLNTLIARPTNAAVGLGLLVCGIPIYILFFKPMTEREKETGVGR